MNKNETCLACGSTNLVPSLNLGEQPLANNLTDEPTNQATYPLGVNLCTDCFHLQLTHTVDPKIIYENYLYVSGTSQTLKDYCDWFAGYVTEHIIPGTYNILDIGCNDGTQLDYFKQRGFNTYGIDPAENIYPTSSQNHRVICDFFGPHIVGKIKENFDAITAQNVCAHNPNPLGFLVTCRQLMSDHTLLFVQTSQADMVLNNEFDTIYHEHVNFFNINSMNKLAKRAGLNLVDVIKTPIHGNSYIFVMSKMSGRPYHIQNLMAMEKKLQNKATYVAWESTIKENMNDLIRTLDEYRNNQYKIIGYGAAAKGNTLLNFINQKMDYIIDDSPLKQNKYAPGTNSPIVPIDILNSLTLDDKVLFMPLAWNFFTEISNRIKVVRDNKNDKFLKYFPKVEIANV